MKEKQKDENDLKIPINKDGNENDGIEKYYCKVENNYDGYLIEIDTELYLMIEKNNNLNTLIKSNSKKIINIK